MTTERPLRYAVLGCGFWSQFQIAAWEEVGGVELVALYNRTKSRALAMGERFGVAAQHVYDEAEALMGREDLDFVDIITDVDSHCRFVELAAAHRVPVICQKPMAPDLVTAQRMVTACREAGVSFMVHENWRWQRPMRELKAALRDPGMGRPFRGRVSFLSSFPVFDNQPFLRELEQFIITDIGSHILDTARFLFGDAGEMYCRTRRVNPGIRGEDVATVVMQMGDECTVTCEMSYASTVEHDRFPETYVFVECDGGSIELGPDFWLRITTPDTGTVSRRCPPSHYGWADPEYDVVHESIVACNRDLLRALQKGDTPETSADDNLRTVQLVFGAYQSAAEGRLIRFGAASP